jgi:hypothetical protein
MNEAETRRAAGIVAGAAWLMGLVAFASSIHLAPMAREGAVVLSLLQMNQIGALVTGVVAMIALFGIAFRVGDLVVGAGVGFAGAAIVQVAQLGRAANWFGGDASTLTFFATVAVGLLVLSFPPRQPA